MKHHYLIDYENVHEDGLTGLNTIEEDAVIHIFYSDRARKLDLDSFREGQILQIEALKVPVGKQSLDMQLVSYMGYLMGREKGQGNAYIIVSKDNGYLNSIPFWRQIMRDGTTVEVRPQIRPRPVEESRQEVPAPKAEIQRKPQAKSEPEKNISPEALPSEAPAQISAQISAQKPEKNERRSRNGRNRGRNRRERNTEAVVTVAEPKQEYAADTTAEAKTEPAVEVKAEPKSEPVIETKPEPKVEPVIETKPEPKAEPVIEAKPEPKTEPVMEAKPESKVKPVIEAKPEPKAEPVVEAKPEPKTEPVVEAKSEPKAEPTAEAKPEPEPVAEAAPKKSSSSKRKKTAKPMDRSALNTTVMQTLSKANIDAATTGKVSSAVMKLITEDQNKTMIYREIIRNFGQKRGLELYNLIKSLL